MEDTLALRTSFSSIDTDHPHRLVIHTFIHFFNIHPAVDLSSLSCPVSHCLRPATVSSSPSKPSILQANKQPATAASVRGVYHRHWTLLKPFHHHPIIEPGRWWLCDNKLSDNSAQFNLCEGIGLINETLQHRTFWIAILVDKNLENEALKTAICHHFTIK